MSGPTLPAIIISSAAPVAAASVLGVPPGAPEWVAWVAALIGACAGPAFSILATRVAPRVLAGRRAKKEALAAAKERRAKALRADGDPTNDRDAGKLEDEADALRAEAAELDALAKNPDAQTRGADKRGDE